MLSSHKINIRNAQLSSNPHSQSSAFIKFTFTMLSALEVHIRNGLLSQIHIDNALLTTFAQSS